MTITLEDIITEQNGTITGRRTGRHMIRRRGKEVGETLMEVEILACTVHHRGTHGKPILAPGEIAWVQWGTAIDDIPHEGDWVVELTEGPDVHRCAIWGIPHSRIK